MSVVIRKLLTDVVSTGVAVGAVLAAILNLAPEVHLGGQYVAWITIATSVVAAVVAQARRYASAQVAARRAAR